MADIDLAPEEGVANARTESAYTHFGTDQVGAAALRPVAEAWLDRWTAIGGNFGVRQKPGGKDEPLIGCIEPRFWKPTDEGRADLKPHEWIVDREHQRGAKRVLEGLLTLTPGLTEAVLRLAIDRAMLPASVRPEEY